MPYSFHTGTDYIDVSLSDTAWRPVLSAAVFPHFPPAASVGLRNTDIGIIHELWFYQFVPGETGAFRVFYGPFEPPEYVFVLLPLFFGGLVISDDGGLEEFVESFSNRTIFSPKSLTNRSNTSILFCCASMIFNLSAATFSQTTS
jgi:hypothetical protein